MNITKITVGRLYNLGNYEHIRYDLTVDVKEGEDASVAIVGVERILAGLKPDRFTKTKADLDRQRRAIEEAKAMPLEEFELRHGNPVGGPAEYIKRLEEGLADDTRKLDESARKYDLARKLFNDLEGASHWKDAKWDWDRTDDL